MIPPFPPTAGPWVVATVNRPEDIASALAPDVAADLLEWRLDGLRELSPGELREAVARSARPVLLTARRRDEGGFSDWPSESARRQSLAALGDLARWVDVEARTLGESGEWRSAVAAWRNSGIGLVVSAHDFAAVPAPDALARTAAIAEENKADVLKVAATPGSLEAVHALGAVFALPGASRRSVMAMGRFGLASRLLFAAAGSVFNYGYLREASVPGQWPCGELKRWIQSPS